MQSEPLLSLKAEYLMCVPAENILLVRCFFFFFLLLFVLKFQTLDRAAILAIPWFFFVFVVLVYVWQTGIEPRVLRISPLLASVANTLALCHFALSVSSQQRLEPHGHLGRRLR